MSDLCKKHSFGYEPLKLLFGETCLLCLRAKNRRLKEALEEISDAQDVRATAGHGYDATIDLMAKQALKGKPNEQANRKSPRQELCPGVRADEAR